MRCATSIINVKFGSKTIPQREEQRESRDRESEEAGVRI